MNEGLKEFSQLREWVKKCPAEAAMRIEDLEHQLKEKNSLFNNANKIVINQPPIPGVIQQAMESNQRMIAELRESLHHSRGDFYTLQKSTDINLARLQKEVEKLKRFYNYFDELYGKGLEIANWHANGMLESFDSFFDEAKAETEEK